MLKLKKKKKPAKSRYVARKERGGQTKREKIRSFLIAAIMVGVVFALLFCLILHRIFARWERSAS